MTLAMLFCAALLGSFLGASVILGSYASWGNQAPFRSEVLSMMVPSVLALVVSIGGVYAGGHIARELGIRFHRWPDHEFVNRRRYLIATATLGALAALLVYLTSPDFVVSVRITSVTIVGLVAALLFLIVVVGLMRSFLPAEVPAPKVRAATSDKSSANYAPPVIDG